MSVKKTNRQVNVQGQEQKKESEQKKRLEKIYVYSMDVLNIKLERKHHLEIKSLYILQATAILITLFVGFQDNISNNLSIQQQANFIFFRNSFYITILVSLVALLLSLFDKISGQFQDVQYPSVLYYDYPRYTILKEFYEEQVKYISNSIESVDSIIKKKIKIHSIGLIFFIIAVILLIIIGFTFV